MCGDLIEAAQCKRRVDEVDSTCASAGRDSGDETARQGSTDHDDGHRSDRRSDGEPDRRP